MAGCFGKCKGGKHLLMCAKCTRQANNTIKNFPLLITVDREVPLEKEGKKIMFKRRFVVGFICSKCAAKDVRLKKGLTVRGRERKVLDRV